MRNRHVANGLRCLACGNIVGNHFTVVGRGIRNAAEPLPAGLDHGATPSREQPENAKVSHET